MPVMHSLACSCILCSHIFLMGQTVEFGARDDADLGAERRGGESRP